MQAYGKIESNAALTLLIFPEGTRWTEKKYNEAVHFATERKLHVPVHTMIPRYKGFQALVRGLDGVATHVYDITLAYKGWDLPQGSKGPGNFALFKQEMAAGANMVRQKGTKGKSAPWEEGFFGGLLWFYV